MGSIAIIGAGPYGLSIAAYLRQTGQRFRIFGVPMETWRERMPTGMRLKSEGFASTLYDPQGAFPLARFCQERGIAYAPIGLPVELQTFCNYGLEFQRRYVPMLEPTRVEQVYRSQAGFELKLATGETASFRQVVCAIGIEYYAYSAPAVSALPPSYQSHSSMYGDLSRFAGKVVAVVGGGSSATDCAALLAQAGATTHLVFRGPHLAFHEPPRSRTLIERLRYPMTPIGPSWRSLMCTQMPLVFHAMPETFRLAVVRRYLGPASCWFVRDVVERSISLYASTQITSASVREGKAVLAMTGEGPPLLEVDHVMAATGYRADLRRLTFLDAKLRSNIRTVNHTPVLSRTFESSVPGLYFVGPTAANAFGPLVRFACGANFTSRRLARHLNS
jgi:hypothetical protein